MTIKEMIAAKLTSGRFLFAITAAITFGILACNKIISPEQDMTVIILAATFYFNRERSQGNQAAQGNQTPTSPSNPPNNPPK